MITRTVSKNPRTTRGHLVNDLQRAGTKVTKATISNTLRRQGLKSCSARRVPLLKPVHVQARLKFAREHLDDPEEDWENVIWSDETKIELFGCFPGGSPEFPAAALNMTKLLEWLLGVSLVLAAWAVVSFDLLELRLPQSYREAAWPMPLYLLVSFGCYSLGTVGYRVATFNDCDEASAELLGQIQEAKQDLRKKGLKI
ncbi:hypothetical protein JOQ06_016210 [Pogonophryne albipinna]|uniref:Dolichol-phosphate mannose synthase subunit 3 n=2 Tax=Notothenioidei TaxID=8205 RepID=A0AAD6APC0_9TELE|nr:hypothetical protein JOQ06_016210 [Pogonophryne albipinna]